MKRSDGLAWFPTTDWTLIGQSVAETDLGRARLGDVLEIYSLAIRRYLRLVRRMRLEEAEEAVQDFLTTKFVTRQLPSVARSDRGRFRNLLVKSLEHFLISRERKRQVRARIGGASLGDSNLSLTAGDLDPAEAFERQWGEAVLTEALARTRRHFETTGQVRIWHAFERRVVAPLTEGTPPVPYGDLVNEFSFATPTQASNALTTAKRALDRELRQLLRQDAGPGGCANAELEDFLQIFNVAQRSTRSRRR